MFFESGSQLGSNFATLTLFQGELLFAITATTGRPLHTVAATMLLMTTLHHSGTECDRCSIAAIARA